LTAINCVHSPFSYKFIGFLAPFYDIFGKISQIRYELPDSFDLFQEILVKTSLNQSLKRNSLCSMKALTVFSTTYSKTQNYSQQVTLLFMVNLWHVSYPLLKGSFSAPTHDPTTEFNRESEDLGLPTHHSYLAPATPRVIHQPGNLKLQNILIES
jgi:hypothetical protein